MDSAHLSMVHDTCPMHMKQKGFLSTLSFAVAPHMERLLRLRGSPHAAIFGYDDTHRYIITRNQSMIAEIGQPHKFVV